MSSIVQRQVWLSAMTAAFIGPMISAYFYEANGQYILGFAGAAILAVVAICPVLLVKNLLIVIKIIGHRKDVL